MFHSGLPSVAVNGKEQRWCQQCGRFHDLASFDGDRKTCRAKLNRHNSRRKTARGLSRVSGDEQPAAVAPPSPGPLQPPPAVLDQQPTPQKQPPQPQPQPSASTGSSFSAPSSAGQSQPAPAPALAAVKAESGEARGCEQEQRRGRAPSSPPPSPQLPRERRLRRQPQRAPLAAVLGEPRLQRVASVDSCPMEAQQAPPQPHPQPQPAAGVPEIKVEVEVVPGMAAARWQPAVMEEEEEDDDGDRLVMCCQPLLQNELQEVPTGSSLTVPLPPLGVGGLCSPLLAVPAGPQLLAQQPSLTEQHSCAPQRQLTLPPGSGRPASKYLKSIDLRHVFPSQGHQQASCKAPPAATAGGACSPRGAGWVGAPLPSNNLDELLKALSSDPDALAPSPWMSGGTSTIWTSGQEVTGAQQPADAMACAAVPPVAEGNGADGGQAVSQKSTAWQWMASWPASAAAEPAATRFGPAAGTAGVCSGMGLLGSSLVGKGSGPHAGLIGEALGSGEFWGGFPLWHEQEHL